MNQSNDEQEPKLIIDDDWKAQVQKEKEELELKEQQAEEASTPAADSPAADSAKQSDDKPFELPPPPPATFEMLVSMLASQAIMSMGKMPNPVTGEAETNKPYARHYIDTIAMLEEKSKGNLTDDEDQMLSQTLHQLRMLFVSA